MKTCVIFTDTERLARKYSVTQSTVMEMISRNLLLRGDFDFQLLDAADYGPELKAMSTWEGYKEILIDFFLGMGIEQSPETSVFIIGGDDVIPMPRLESPIAEGEMIDADFAYCFKEICPALLDVDAAMCNVGRLPMENGNMPRPIRDDLQSYFNLATMFMDQGIEIDNILMTSTVSWLPASAEMVRDLPALNPRQVSGFTHENMYVSPLLDTDCENRRLHRQYCKDLAAADLLMFNLHGADAPGYSSFYGEGEGGHNTPEAFSVEMISEIGARIFNTVACFGARYIGYNRNQSMLLTAMYGGGVVLYCGACVSALGRSGPIHNAANDILIPAGMSESLMKLYTHYIIKGIPAGEALLKAKCDYFNTCRSLDGDDCAYATVLMFNLYGLPVLKSTAKRNSKLTGNAVKPLPFSRHDRAAVTPLFDKSGGSESILAHVRSLVDSNLQKIRQIVEGNLYDHWGIDPQSLHRIDRLAASNGGPTKLCFEFKQSGRTVGGKTWAFATEKGELLDVIHFKGS